MNYFTFSNDFRDHQAFPFATRSFLTEFVYKLCREKISHFRLRVAENAIDSQLRKRPFLELSTDEAWAFIMVFSTP